MQYDLDNTTLKLPPHNIDAERNVLGAILFDPSVWHQIGHILEPQDFFRPPHAQIFKVMKELNYKSKVPEFALVADLLESTKLLEQIGGLEYLADLSSCSPTISNAVSYAKVIKDKSALRRIIALANLAAERAYNTDGKTVEEIVSLYQSEAMGLTDGEDADAAFHHFSKISKDMLATLEARSTSSNELIGLSTGLNDLDRKLLGLQRKSLYIIAGRPAMGKTSLAMNIAEHAAQTGQRTAVFSVEMDSESLALRSYANYANIPFQDLQKAKMKDEQWSGLAATMNRLSDIPLYIDDSSQITPNQMRSKLRTLINKIKNPLDLILVDYIQLMKGDSNFRSNREGEISEITRSLKLMSKEFNCPIVALSQLNRQLEQRPNKRPRLSDLRESGAIEQDADVIMFVYRDEVYNDPSPFVGTAEIIIGKFRNGQLGTVYVKDELGFCRFANKYDKTDQMFNEPRDDGGLTW